jgi:hypothetical protein
MIINIDKIDCQETIHDMYYGLMSDTHPWYWNENIITCIEGQHAGFTHVFYKDGKINSSYFDKTNNLLNLIANKEQIKIKSIYRIQANLLPNINITEKQLETSIHTDMPTNNYRSIIYYVMDSDGDTVIFNDDKEVRVSPEQGKYVIFNSNLYHRATIPTINKRRIVINYIVEVE